MKTMPVTVGFPQIRNLMSGEMTTLLRPRAQRLSMLRPGDLLWVREPWCFDARFEWNTPLSALTLGAKPIFLADFAPDGLPLEAGKPRIAYTLPRACHRQHLKVTSVETMRLHDLADAAIEAQGFDNPEDWAHAWNRSLSVSGPGRNRFEDNPLVLAIHFARIARPILEPVLEMAR